MKKNICIGLLTLLVLPLSGCASRDTKLIDKYLTTKFSEELLFDRLNIYFSQHETISGSKIEGLDGIYTLNYFVFEFSDSLSVEGTNVILNPSYLSKDKEINEQIEIDVKNISLDFKKTYVVNLRAKTYLYYLPHIYVGSGSGDLYREGDYNFTYSYTTVNSGHFYHYRKISLDMNLKTFEFYRKDYENDVHGTYNEVISYATYYFGDNHRIVSDKGVTYYESDFANLPTDREDVIGDGLNYFTKLNNIFKYYQDTQYITSIS